MTPSESSSKSHATGWTVSMLAVIPILYFALTPPIVYGVIIMSGGGTLGGPIPAWLEIPIAPYRWFCDFPATKEPFMAYADWWAQVLHVLS